MTLDRVVDCRRSAVSSSSSTSVSGNSSSFLHGVKRAVILLCPGDSSANDQSSRLVGPGRAVRVQFSTPTTTTAGDSAQQSVDTDR